MKKFYSFLIAAVALVGFAACESNEEAATPEAEIMSFVASFADETRTALADAEGNVKWCADDTILVTNGVTTKTFTATSVDGATATFTGERMDGETFYAIYGGEDATFANGEWTYTVSATQTAKNGTFADGAAVSTAVCTDGKTLAFENQCAVLKFQVPATASAVEFFNGSTSVVKVTGTMKTGEVYYATVAPGTYTFTVKVDGVVVKESSKALELVANKIYNLKTLPGYEVLGTFNNWTKGKNYMTVEGDYLVCKNVNFATDGKFKFFIEDGSQYGAYYGREADNNHKVVSHGNYYYAADAADIEIKQGTYDLYFAKDCTTFLVMNAGSKYNANNWVIYGSDNIEGIDKGWNTESYIPMITGGDGQYYLTITFTGDAYFKIFKIVDGNKWWRESNNDNSDQVLTTTGTQCGDESGEGKAFKISATGKVTKTFGFNDSQYIWLQK